MTKSISYGLFTALVAAALVSALPATTPVASAQDLSYTVVRWDYPMSDACSSAVTEIQSHCDAGHGPISVQPRGCKPLYDFFGNLLGYICKCEARTTFCQLEGPGIG